jgi:signal transduction histidine kinase
MMKNSSSRVWLIYALCVAALLGGMALMTRRALDLERAEREARGKAAVQERIRLALWRMDSSMAAMLARESARPWSHYVAFSPQSPEADATKEREKTDEPGALLASPLLTGAPDYARLYFQVMPDGRVVSPQVPEGGQRGMALLADADPRRIDRAAAALERVAAIVPELKKGSAQTSWATLGRGRSSPGFGGLEADPMRERAAEENVQSEPIGAEQAKSQKDLEARQWVLNQAVTGQRANSGSNSAGVPGALNEPGTDVAGRPIVPTAGATSAERAERRVDAEANKAEAAAQAAGADAGDSAQVSRKSDDEADQQKFGAVGDQSPPPPPGAAPASGAAKPTAMPAPGLPATSSSPGGTSFADQVPRRSVQLGERLRIGVFDSTSNAVVLGPDEPGELVAVCIVPMAVGVSESVSQKSLSAVSRDSRSDELPATDRSPSRLVERSEPTGAVEPEILLVREGPSAGTLQGVWLEWPLVRGQLLGLIEDLLPGATLEALPRGMDGRATGTGGAGNEAVLEAQTLVSVPVRLTVPEETMSMMMPPAASMVGSTRVGFLLGWLSIVAAAAAIGLVLRASVELSERRGRFVSAVTHELRTPLTTFRLYSQMLADGMVRDEEARGEYHRTLRSEAERLSRIVESVLDYAKLGKRGPGAMWASVPARELLERLTPMLAARAEAGGLTLKIDADLGDGVTVSADPSAVERIMLNLVENACKYAGGMAWSSAADSERDSEGDSGRESAGGAGGTSPKVEEKLLVLRARVERRRVVLVLRDFGPGVPERERRRIFRPFQRGAGQESGTTPGLGLGLAFSRGLARDMGGDLVLVKRGRESVGTGVSGAGSAGTAEGGSGRGAEFELWLMRA